MRRVINYRNRDISLSDEKIRLFEELSGYRFDESHIDQYLLNDTDKEGLEPFNFDFDEIASRFSVEEIERIVDEYLDFEIELRDNRQ